jgi:hypothetical protein
MNNYWDQMKSLLIKMLIITLMFSGCRTFQSGIDRYRLVKRHNPELNEADPWSPFTVGNGEFAFTADITGLQSYPSYYYTNGIPLETLSNWGWHTFPNPENYTIEDACVAIPVGNKLVQYPILENTSAGRWLRRNPHRIPLAQIGMNLINEEGQAIQLNGIEDIKQNLNMWNGLLESRFSIQNVPVHVITVCHPQLDLIGVRIKSSLIETERLQISIRFPYSHDQNIKNDPPLDWDQADKHHTEIIYNNSRRAILKRMLDHDKYFVNVAWEESCKFKDISEHHYIIKPSEHESEINVIFMFTPDEYNEDLPSVSQTVIASKDAWKNYWKSGGAIDFSGSKDELAQELERRVVLSQYLVRAQCAGIIPPQESGLTCSTWHGKFHTEMIWWNTAHYLLWGRDELLEKSCSWYLRNLEYAKETAERQGFAGVRWSKMVGPEGRESPGNNPFIQWNEPHPIHLAEMIYQANPNRAVLEKYKDVVFETAEYMADFALWNEQTQHYDLGPPIWPVQEVFLPLDTKNPIFELAYWAYGLNTAQKWLERLGQKKNKKWERVEQNLAPLPVSDSLYIASEIVPDIYCTPRWCADHPSMLMPLGFLPGVNVDKTIMKRTLEKVLRVWDWEAKIWGWDYPMIAMTAARLGEPKLAVGMLLMNGPNNQYMNNGHCPQGPRLPVYLPANGSLLSAVAMMAAGWQGSEEDLPGFPRDGNWKVRWEGLRKMP